MSKAKSMGRLALAETCIELALALSEARSAEIDLEFFDTDTLVSIDAAVLALLHCNRALIHRQDQGA